MKPRPVNNIAHLGQHQGPPIIAWGGLWRDSAEWGPVYSGVMTEANEAIKPLHDRMPVFLFENEWDKWMTGSFDDLLAFQARKFPDDLIEMERTPELWVTRKKEGVPAAPLGRQN